LAGLASRMAVRIGAEYCCGVHDDPPGYAWKHCSEKYGWTPVCFTTLPHHGLVWSYHRRATFETLPNRDKLNCIRHRVHHPISGCHGERLRERRGESTLSNNVPNGELWWESV